MDYHPLGRAPIRRYRQIGFGESAAERLKALRWGSPDRLAIIGRILTNNAARLEQELHLRFAHLHSHGEWHRPGDELLAYIAEHGQSYEADAERELRTILEMQSATPAA